MLKKNLAYSKEIYAFVIGNKQSSFPHIHKEYCSLVSHLKSDPFNVLYICLHSSEAQDQMQ